MDVKTAVSFVSCFLGLYQMRGLHRIMTRSQETTTSAVEIPESATLRDIARAAGVSLATVSRALNGSGGRTVSAEKRTLILNAAEQLHYRPGNVPRRHVAAG